MRLKRDTLDSRRLTKQKIVYILFISMSISKYGIKLILCKQEEQKRKKFFEDIFAKTSSIDDMFL